MIARGWRTLLGRGPAPADPTRPPQAEWPPRPAAAPPPAAWRAAARALGDRAPLDAAMHAALGEEIAARAAGFAPGWPAPRLTGLVVRHDGLPDWWGKADNLMLAPADAKLPDLLPSWGAFPRDALVAIGRNAGVMNMTIGGGSAMAAIGDECRLPFVGLHVSDAVLSVGEYSSATVYANFDARNGGALLVGADMMAAGNVRLITDDMHAIRDLSTGDRINHRGGRLVIEPHVWLGENVMIVGETRIGEHCVVGAGSFAKGCALPAHTVGLGRPIRIVRTGVTWTREDLP